MSSIKPWREVAKELLLDRRIVRIERSVAVSPEDGEQHEFTRIAADDWAQIVPVTRDGRIVMVKQYRHGSQSVVLEIPGGLVGPGEDPAAAAARECLEETGYLAREPRSLGSINPNPALFSNRLHSFYAHGVERVADVQNTGSEQTEVVLLTRREVEAGLRDNSIDHALVAALLWRYLSEHARDLS